MRDRWAVRKAIETRNCPNFPSVRSLINLLVSVAMRQSPFAVLAPEYLGDAQSKDRLLRFPGFVQAIGLDAHDIGEIARCLRIEDLALVGTVREMRRRPIQSRSDLFPSPFGTAEASKNRHVLAMRVEVLQVRCVALDEIAVGDIDLKHGLLPGFSTHRTSSIFSAVANRTIARSFAFGSVWKINCSPENAIFRLAARMP